MRAGGRARPATAPQSRRDRARLAGDPRSAADRASPARIRVVLLARRDARVVVLAPAAVWDRGREVLAPVRRALRRRARRCCILLGRPARARSRAGPEPRPRARCSPPSPPPTSCFVAMHNAFELLEAKARAESRGKWLNRYRYELGELIEIARAITTERDIDKLLGLILEKSRFITGADAGSIYVVEGDDRTGRRMLRFKLSQNDSVDLRLARVHDAGRARARWPAASRSREAASTSPTSTICPPGSPYGFDRSLRREDRLPHRNRC